MLIFHILETCKILHCHDFIYYFNNILKVSNIFECYSAHHLVTQCTTSSDGAPPRHTVHHLAPSATSLRRS